jgi:macrolide-specific efflux system membrane fusion protein
VKGRRLWFVNGSLLVVIAVIALVAVNTIFQKASAHAAVRTATATLGTVDSTVTATGNVSPAQSEDLSFSTAGTVSSIEVSVGQKVKAGQVVAKLDPTSAQASLTAADDDLTAAEDNLALARAGGETPPQEAEDAASVASAEAQVSNDQTLLTTAQTQLADDQAVCAADGPSASSGKGSSTANWRLLDHQLATNKAVTQAGNSLDSGAELTDPDSTFDRSQAVRQPGHHPAGRRPGHSRPNRRSRRTPRRWPGRR